LDSIFFFKSAEDKKEDLNIADIKAQITRLRELLSIRKKGSSEKGKNREEEFK
jgi:hypothetical protein